MQPRDHPYDAEAYDKGGKAETAEEKGSLETYNNYSNDERKPDDGGSEIMTGSFKAEVVRGPSW